MELALRPSYPVRGLRSRSRSSWLPWPSVRWRRDAGVIAGIMRNVLDAAGIKGVGLLMGTPPFAGPPEGGGLCGGRATAC